MIHGRLLLAAAPGDEREFILESACITLGRAPDNDIVLDDPEVSRHHARLTVTADGVLLEDLKSSFGTTVGGERINSRLLRHGDIIGLSSVQMRFLSAAADETAEGTVVEVGVARDVTLEEAALQATITHTLIDMSPAVAKEAILQDATFEEVLPDRSPRLIVREGGATRDVRLTASPLTIGRDTACQVVLTSPLASRRHAQIRPQNGGYVLIDLRSTNGTTVNGQLISGPHHLADGDLITIGKVVILFKSPVAIAPAHLPHRRGRRPVVIIPGFMGSELRRGNMVLWPNYPYILSNPYAISPGSGPVQVSRIIHETVVVPHLIKIDSYSRLTRYLEIELGYRAGIDLLEFPYDWRQDNRTTAQELAAAISAWRAKQGHGPVTIIAHSMGGLVTRYYLDQLRGHEHVERFIAMGTPHMGSPKGLPPVLPGPGYTPFGIAREKIRTVVLSAPSVYQVFPCYPCVFDLQNKVVDILADDSWLPHERRKFLKDAAEFFASLSIQPPVSTLCIFGYGQPTTSRVIVERRDTGLEMIRYEVAAIGDGTVPEESAVLEGADIHPVRQRHGAIFADPDVQRRLRYELTERRLA